MFRSNSASATRLALASAAILAAVSTPLAQTTQPKAPDSTRHSSDIDSGWVANTSTDPWLQNTAIPIWSQVVHVPNAGWLRLYYEGVMLSGDREGGNGSYLRIYSLRDGYHMTQHSLHVGQWQNTSAYFNGDAVVVEIYAYPGTGQNRFVLNEIEAGAPPTSPDSICGPTDDRQLSSDPRVGRNQPTGCTSWLIDDCEHCFITAGHCTNGANTVQFNVPLSSGSGSLNHPPPTDQYAIDPASMQSNGGQGIGDDWAYFGVFANSTTGLEAYQAQGQWFNLRLPPSVSNQNIRITGYGTVGSPVSQTWNQVQKTHVGPYFSFAGTTLRYTTDTTGGNSGSPVIDESTGNAIGVHTHAGCEPANHGTGANHSAWRNALANPQGVCICQGLSFTLPNGRPSTIDPNGGTTVRVVVAPNGGNTPVVGSGMLHYNAGTGFQAVAMTEVSPNVYDAVFPAFTCESSVAYYFSAQDTTGGSHTDPANAPGNSYDAIAVAGVRTAIAYDFNTVPPNWTVNTTNPGSTQGIWEIGTPAGNGGNRRDPSSDFDGSGQCWVTGNGFNDDVDDGPTVLETEVFDLSSMNNPRVRYARWYMNDDGDDAFVIEISQNGGAGWFLMESVLGDTAGWVDQTWELSTFISRFDQVRFRFIAQDVPNNSVTEAGIDAFEIFDVVCIASEWSTGGMSCAGTAGSPVLDSTDLPSIGSTFTSTISSLPTSAAVFAQLGFNLLPNPIDLGAIGMNGCTLYVNGVGSFALTPNASGVATWDLQIPNDNGLLGLRLYQQAFAIDPGANQLGATSTNYGVGKMGQ